MDSQTYSAGAVVNYFLEHAEKYGITLTPMKLQKMLYFANGWSWAFFDRPLISEECKAWEFGPVYPSVYHEYKQFRGKAIPNTQLMKEYDYADPAYQQEIQEAYERGFTSLNFPPMKEFHVPSDDNQTTNLLDNILKVYGQAGAIALSDWTHVDAKDNPWKLARENKTSDSPAINIEHIKAYFGRLKREGRVK